MAARIDDAAIKPWACCLPTCSPDRLEFGVCSRIASRLEFIDPSGENDTFPDDNSSERTAVAADVFRGEFNRLPQETHMCLRSLLQIA